MTIKILRTMYPYLTDDEKEYYIKYHQELKEKGITYEDEAKRIFKKIGMDFKKDLVNYY